VTTYENFADVKAHKPVKWWHEAIINDLIAYPLDTGKQRAARLQYNEQYLNVIINSDMFKALFAQRRAEYAARLDASLTTKTAEAAGLALDLLMVSMNERRDKIPFEKLADFADKSLSRLGYGNAKQPAVAVNVDNRTITISKEELADARNTIRCLESQRATTQIEHQHSPVDVLAAEESEGA